MENGDHPVSNSCASLPFASKNLLTTVHTFFHSLIVMSPLLLGIRYGQLRFVGCHSDTSNEAHNPLRFSVEKHSNNFVVSNDVLVLEYAKDARMS